MPKNAIPPLPTLPMQLMLTMGTWLTSPFALQCANVALPHWKPGLEANEALQSAIAQEAKNRASELLSGVLRYVEKPYARDVSEKSVVWQCGNARLLDYGLDVLKPKDIRTVALFVPSLINKYYILDLEKERSLLRYLPTQGIYPLVLDWGTPGTFEKDFGCEEYISEILLPAIDFIHASSGRIALAGYCMGGVLALAAAKLRRSKLSSLALFATPWDFHCKEFAPFVVDKPWQKMIASMIATQKNIPADVIQSLFYMTDPFVFEHKFRRFAELDPESRAAQDFVALEHWVNDGVSMTTKMAHDCLINWAQNNQLANGEWEVSGKIINPKTIKLPIFIAIPDQDHVVPKDCAMPLAAAMKHAHVTHPGAGHVGMIVGSKAKKELWQPLAEWLAVTKS